MFKLCLTLSFMRHKHAQIKSTVQPPASESRVVARLQRCTSPVQR